jgi:putative addiction module component (TIGR02574 family)
MLADIPNYDQFSVAAKLRLVGEIWDDIFASGEPIPFEEWDREEAIRRDKEMESDPSIALTLEEVWQKVDEMRG